MPKPSNLDTSAAASVSASDRSNNLGDSLWSAPNSFIVFLHNTAQLPPDAVPRLVSEFPSLQLTDTYAATSHNLDASLDFVLPDSLSSESVGMIDPSLLSGSELPFKLPLSSLPPSTGTQQLRY
ncbi:hypothetical protein F4604DRAFT_1921725 [Suillus subluteus]|nr:hypothetical protein F4604DRAFT_1921725 [Suillus subluteus]